MAATAGTAATGTSTATEVRHLVSTRLDRSLYVGILEVNVTAAKEAAATAATATAAAEVRIGNVEALIAQASRERELAILPLGLFLGRQFGTRVLDQRSADLHRGLYVWILSIDISQESSGASTRREVGVGHVESFVAQTLGEHQKDILRSDLLGIYIAWNAVRVTRVSRCLLAFSSRRAWGLLRGASRSPLWTMSEAEFNSPEEPPPQAATIKMLPRGNVDSECGGLS